MTFIQGLGSATRINCFEGHHLHSKVLNSQQKRGCCGFIFIDHFNSEVAVWMVEEAFGVSNERDSHTVENIN